MVKLKTVFNEEFNNIFFVISVILYRITLDIAMVFIVSNEYHYMGFGLNIDYIKLIESYLLLILITTLIKGNVEKPSEFFIIFLFSLIVVPITTIYSLQNQPREFLYFIFLSFFIISFLCKKSLYKVENSRFKKVKLQPIKNSREITIYLCLSISILIFLWIIIRGGLSYLNLNLLKVYNYRAIVAERIFPGKLAYIMNWFGKVINPFLLAYFLEKKNKKFIILAVCAQVLFFAVTAHKSMLFYPILVYFVYIFANKKFVGYLIPAGIACLNIVAIIIYYISGNIVILSFFIRRVLLLTAKIHYNYYNFFNINGFVYYSNRSWFPKIINYPYDQPIQLVVSESGGWANTGFLANGYAHFGFMGMIIYSIIIALTFKYIDHIANNYLSKRFCIAMMITPIFGVLNSDLTTVFLTGGLFLAMILLWLMSGNSLRSSTHMGEIEF